MSTTVLLFLIGLVALGLCGPLVGMAAVRRAYPFLIEDGHLVAGRVVSKERISQSVLGRPLGPYDRSIDVHVSNLRRKIADAGDGSSPITTIHRSGYLLRQPEP